MASSVLKRCVTAAVKVNRLSPSFSAKRWMLSAAYTDTKLWESREKDPQNLAELASNMDRTYEKNLPVSSLAVSRFVDNITSREEVDQAEYYIYKFRHSPNCWYMREWMVHSWIRQCLKYEAKEKALYTLKNKVQYGIFPDDFTFNLLLDCYIKDGDYKNACSIVEEVMFQEAFDLPSTQILSLHVLSVYLASKPQLTLIERRNLGASLLICGLTQDNNIGLNTQLLGNTLLGLVEISKGIHAVFKGMPLFWGRGYLGRALDIMEKVSADTGDMKLTAETLDSMNDLLQELSSSSSSASDSESSGEESGDEEVKKIDVLDEDDLDEQARLPNYINRFKELRSLLESQGKVDSASLQDLVNTLAQQKLDSSEKLDLEEYEKRVQAWEVDRKSLIEREKEMRQMAEEQRQRRLAARAAAQQE